MCGLYSPCYLLNMHIEMDPIDAKNVRRKLTAILSADAEGYSRLMGEDEVGTVHTLTVCKEVMNSIIPQYGGRVIDSPGDNLLAEFASVVDALQCAVAIQKDIKIRNDELPENRRMRFRIGINLGDVIQEKDRIYGDGVNIAARLESLAAGGGICISSDVYGQVKNKLDLEYEYLGKKEVKNIAEPVKAYRVMFYSDPLAHGVNNLKIARGKSWRMISAAVSLVLAFSAATVFIWNLYFYPRSQNKVASVENMAFPLPDKPSIAVLPFENMSDDPKQDYFSDGMTEDLITDLSKISSLFVIARNSSFTYKGKPVKIQQVSEELGVRYVLEGSVRKAGNQVRINAQLIDATTGGHLWAERYDGTLADIFALQDRVTQNIVAALAVTLTAGEERQAFWNETANIAAYDSFLQGWSQYVRHTPDGFANAVSHFEKAIELDPQYGRPYAALASTYWESSHRFWNSSLGVTWGEARYLAEQYLEKSIETPTTLTHQVASMMLVDWQRYEEALKEAKRAITLDPNDPNSYRAMAYALIYAGKPEMAVGFAKKSMRLDPLYPAYNLFVIGLAYFSMERFEEAMISFQKTLKLNPENSVVLIPLSATYAQMGRQQEATTAIAKLKEALPMMNVETVIGCPLWRYKNYSDKQRLMDGLRMAGLT